MESLRLIKSGLHLELIASKLAAKSEWVAIGSFGFNTASPLIAKLPKRSHVLVGLTREEEKQSSIILRLRVLKKARPDLTIAYRTDFHAKYGLFKLPDSRRIIVGSANFTSSPAIELSVVMSDEELYRLMLREHEWAMKHAILLEPDNTPKLTVSALKDLSSALVRRK